MKTNIICMIATSAMLMLSGCVSEIENVNSIDDSVNEAEAESSETATITFTLGSSSSRSAAARDTEELQTSDEKTVSTLYAVVFRDIDYDSDDTSEEDDDAYYGIIEILSSSDDSSDSSEDSSDSSEDSSDSSEDESGFSEGETYSFTISGKGNFLVFFVANPSETLLSSIKALTKNISTVEDFKSIVVTDDIATPLLMNSTSFYSVSSPNTESYNIGTVTLRRVVSRIDIYNSTPSTITLTKAVFYNNATSSVLINDSPTAGCTSSYISTDGTSYTLSDKLTDAGYVSQAEIYSYEQFEASDYPKIAISYTVAGNTSTTYTHTVDFVYTTATTDEDGTTHSEDDPVYLQRNHRYLIKVSSSLESTIRFSLLATDETNLDVADWNTGDENSEIAYSEFNISTATIEGSVRDVEVGDFLMSDGTIVKSYNMEDYDGDESAIAVVYTVDQNRIGEYTKNALGGTATGLALALKNSIVSTKSNYTETYWCYSNYNSTLINELTIADYMYQAYADYDGYKNSKTVWDLYSSNDDIYDKFPAFYYAKLYNSDQTGSVVADETSTYPSNTTGWYLPSIGEWFDIAENFYGEDFLDEYKLKTGKYASADGDTFEGYETTLGKALNAAMSKVGEDNYEPIIYEMVDGNSESENRNWFATSSQGGSETTTDTDGTTTVTSSIEAWRVDFNSDKGYLDIDGGSSKQYAKKGGRVRCAIAFYYIE